MTVAAILVLTAVAGCLALVLGFVSSDAGAAIIIAGVGVVLTVSAGLAALISVNQWMVARSVLTELRRAERRMDSLIRSTRTELELQANEHRKAQSRHEYHQELSLERLEGISGTVRGDVEGLVWRALGDTRRRTAEKPVEQRGRPAVLFITSNGAGVGHLTRCAAIARSGKPLFDSSVLSLSAAVHVLSEIGLKHEHFPSREATQLSWPSWNRRFAQHLHSVVRDGEYSAIVFDGAWIYRGVHEVARRFDVPLVWSARPSWQSTANRKQLKNADAYCDAVIRPGDVTGDDEPVGGGVPVYTTSPIVYRGEERQSRATACEHLGFDDSFRYVLVQLGAGVINDIDDARAAAVRAVLDLGQNYRAVIARSPLDKAPLILQPGVEEISVYPLAPWLAAFDACVVAAGYNSVHEAIAANLPMVVVPNSNTVTDDQLWRARCVEERGFGVVVTDSASIAPGLRALTATDSERGRAESMEATGAREAAQIIQTVALQYRGAVSPFARIERRRRPSE